MTALWDGPLKKVNDYLWKIPVSYAEGMNVPGFIFADEKMIEDVRRDSAPLQVANVAHLPGILKGSFAMPDIHWGYGFPIGGVAAFDIDSGIISPGGVGYDINCGVRLIKTDLEESDIRGVIHTLIQGLFQNIPSGVGSTGKLKLSQKQERDVLRDGAVWAVKNGFGWDEDLLFTENRGIFDGADPSALSQRAIQRGSHQLGTLGSGNHFLEIQKVETIFDKEKAEAFGLREGQITIMVHTGSRGLGYQVCDDSLDDMVKAMDKYSIKVPDKQLASAPVNSSEAEKYLAGMAAAANYAWANRQTILHWIRETFERVFNQSAENLGMHMVYDVAHNIAKFEDHLINGQKKKVLVHRKGATRAFGPENPDIPEPYRNTGQPVLIPGDMGTASYVLAGTKCAEKESFGSTCHGAGRVMSRHAAVRAAKGRSIFKEMEERGVVVQSRSRKTLAEESPEAYKDIDRVVNIVHNAGLSLKVARMRPLGVVKG
ncbi:RtcB family protein [bacterium]|nr:RtcB family protein [bacterium]